VIYKKWSKKGHSYDRIIVGGSGMKERTILYDVRRKAGLTQRQAAKGIGVAYDTYRKYEYGTLRMNRFTIENVASFFKVPESIFIYDIDPAESLGFSSIAFISAQIEIDLYKLSTNNLSLAKIKTIDEGYKLDLINESKQILKNIKSRRKKLYGLIKQNIETYQKTLDKYYI